MGRRSRRQARAIMEANTDRVIAELVDPAPASSYRIANEHLRSMSLGSAAGSGSPLSPVGGIRSPMRGDATPYEPSGPGSHTPMRADAPHFVPVEPFSVEPERLVPIWRPITPLPFSYETPYIASGESLRGVPLSRAQLEYEHLLIQGVDWPRSAAFPVAFARGYYHLCMPLFMDYQHFRSSVQDHLVANTIWSAAISDILGPLRQTVQELSLRVASLERAISDIFGPLRQTVQDLSLRVASLERDAALPRSAPIHSVSITPGTHDQLLASIRTCQLLAWAERGGGPVYSEPPSRAPSVAGSEL